MLEKNNMRVFLYDRRIELGTAQFASVDGFKLVSSGFNKCPEAIRDDKNKIYGYIYNINSDILDMLDTYYGLGIKLHKRIMVKAVLKGGVDVSAYMYEFNMELV